VLYLEVERHVKRDDEVATASWKRSECDSDDEVQIDVIALAGCMG
jgi:hypothetical protein